MCVSVSEKELLVVCAPLAESSQKGPRDIPAAAVRPAPFAGVRATNVCQRRTSLAPEPAQAVNNGLRQAAARSVDSPPVMSAMQCLLCSAAPLCRNTQYLISSECWESYYDVDQRVSGCDPCAADD